MYPANDTRGMYPAKHDGDGQLRAHLRPLVPIFDPLQWPSRAEATRKRVREEIFLKGLGCSVLDGDPVVQWGAVIDGPGYSVRKLRYEAIPNYWVPGLLYEPSGRAERPRVAVLNADGHHDSGNAAAYKQVRCINLARRGALALSFEFPGMGELAADAEARLADVGSLHHGLAALELVGIGAPSLMYASMTRALDVLLSHPDTDPDRVAMTGLSGGGWQTIVLSALDTRIRLAVPVAGYTSAAARIEHCSDVGDVEQVPADQAVIVDYPDLTAMLAPRPALLILNEYDECCFRTDRTRREVYDQVLPVYEALGAADSFELYSNTDPGTHTYGAANRSQLYGFLGRHFGEDWPLEDLHGPEEIRSEHDLEVGLPPEQLTVRNIASARARALRVQRLERHSSLSADQRRAEVSQALRLPSLVADALPPTDEIAWQAPIQVGPWVVPCSWSPGPGVPVLSIADEVAPSAGSDGAGAILGVSPLGLRGMPCSHERVMMLQTCGERLLGLQVAQLIAVAERLSDDRGVRVRLRAHGLQSSVVATVAAALSPRLFDRLHLSGNRLVRLDDLIHRAISAADAPALFCPDLLEVTDGIDLRTLLDHVAFFEGDRGSDRM